MIFLNTLLVGALAAAVAPVVVHILHCRKVTQVDWAAMRFLQEMLAKSRRSILIDQWLLLLIRTLLVVCLALAFMRPAWTPDVRSDQLIVRQGQTAAIVVVDDSFSTGMGRSEVRLKRMQDLVVTYIDSLPDGSEISLLRLSELHQPAPDPLLDRSLAKEVVRSMRPSAIGSDWLTLMDAAANQLTKHLNANVEIVMVSDHAAAGWDIDNRAAWAELRRRLITDQEAPVGSRRHPRMLLLEPHYATNENNVAIVALDTDRAIITPHRPVPIRVGLRQSGESADKAIHVRLRVDGRKVDERSLDLRPSELQEVVFEHVFKKSGSHVVEVVLDGARDGLAGDDKRQLAVEVIESMPVLLVEGRHADGLDGSLSFAALALDGGAHLDGESALGSAPQGYRDGEELMPGSHNQAFSVVKIAPADLGSHKLDHYRCLILGDVAGLDNDVLAQIEAYVVSGGGVIVGLGPQTDVEHINRFWARGGDGFLPCPIGELVHAESSLTPAIADAGHPALRAFANDRGASWTGSAIRNWHPLRIKEVPDEHVQILLRYSNGAPAAVERRRGIGSVVLIGTSLDLHYGALAVQPAYVPLMHGLVGHLGGRLLPPRNIQPGQRLAHTAREKGSIGVQDPLGKDIEVTPQTWQGRAVYGTEPLTETGVYTVSDGDEDIHYVVAVDPEEGRTDAVDTVKRTALFSDVDVLEFSDQDELAAALDLAQQKPTEIWTYLILVTLSLLFIETWMTRRLAVTEGKHV